MPQEKCDLNFTSNDDTQAHFQLTQRELQVLQYVTRGYTAKKIARQLDISFRTVEKHTLNIKTKLGCLSKGELIEESIRRGLLSMLFER